MSSNCKIVKCLGLLMLFAGIVDMMLGILAASGLFVVAMESSLIVAVEHIVMGALLAIAGFAGARGANRPSKLMSFVVLMIIYMFLAIFGAALSITSSGGVPVGNVIEAIVGLVAIAYALRAKREANER